jgi:hypothetical protein
MIRLNLVIGILTDVIFSCIAFAFLVVLWLLGAPQPFKKWNDFMDSLIFFDKKK